MGGRSSKPRKKTPVTSYDDGFLLYEGCMALSRADYDEQQLTAAPFLTVPLLGKSIEEIVIWSKLCIMSLGQNKFAEFQAALAAKLKEYQNDGIEIGAQFRGMPGLGLDAKGANGNLTWKMEDSIKKSVEAEYDPQKEFATRLRDLLRILNLLKFERMYIKMFPYIPPTSTEQSNQGIDIPLGLQGQRITTWDTDGIGKSSKLDVPQLPGLPSSSEGDGKRPEYKFLGPAYLFMANNMEGKNKYIEAYMYFPSMTKDALPAPNYDYMGKSHRWLHRLINDTAYSTTGGRCEHTCFQEPPPPPPPSTQPPTKQKHKKKVPPPPEPTTFVACGCRSTTNDKACGKLQTRDLKNKKGKVVSRIPSFVNSYIVYKINLDHPHNQEYFARDSPKELVLNIIPSEWDVYPGCKYSIISRNGRFYTRIESLEVPIEGTFQRGKKRFGRKRRPGTQMFMPAGKFGLYVNKGENLTLLCKSKKKPIIARPIINVQKNGFPRRLTLESGTLNLYFSADLEENDTEVAIWSMEVAEPESSEPLAVVLLDNGRMDVFDRSNKSVMSAKFKQYQEEQWRRYESSNPNDPNIPHDPNAVGNVDVDDLEYRALQGKYDPVVEYARRLMHLKNWLRSRKLLFETVSRYIDLSTMTARRLMKGDESKFLTYDPSEDYRARYGELTKFLRENGYPIS